MAELYNAEVAGVATSGTAKSIIVLTAASTQPFRVPGFYVSGDATGTGLLKVEFLVGTLSGGTTTTAPNKSRMNADAYNKAPVTTATAYSAEPTYSKHASNDNIVVKTIEFVTPFEPWELEWPLGREWYCPESNLLAIRCTATTTTPNVSAGVAFEE